MCLTTTPFHPLVGFYQWLRRLLVLYFTRKTWVLEAWLSVPPQEDVDDVRRSVEKYLGRHAVNADVSDCVDEYRLVSLTWYFHSELSGCVAIELLKRRADFLDFALKFEKPHREDRRDAWQNEGIQ